MTNKSNDPFKNLILDQEEKFIEEALEKDEYISVPDFDNGKKIIEEAASNFLQLNSSKPITLRVNQADLIRIKAKAKRNNIPYQTLLNSLIHDFAEDKRTLKIK